jgi:hypothetical protein
MHNDRSLEPPDRAAPGVNPDLVLVGGGEVPAHPAGDAPSPIDRPRTRSRANGPFARLLSVVRGDKYMANAYEPAWSALMERRAAGAARKER